MIKFRIFLFLFRANNIENNINFIPKRIKNIVILGAYDIMNNYPLSVVNNNFLLSWQYSVYFLYVNYHCGYILWRE
jgi:hypothetical protein